MQHGSFELSDSQTCVLSSTAEMINKKQLSQNQEIVSSISQGFSKLFRFITVVNTKIMLNQC